MEVPVTKEATHDRLDECTEQARLNDAREQGVPWK